MQWSCCAHLPCGPQPIAQFVAGVAYLVVPFATLRAVFGGFTSEFTDEDAFLWRCLGVALITLLPTITYIVKVRAPSRMHRLANRASARMNF